MKKKGFTLAEILITIVVIGVVSAITVPSIMQTTEKQEFVAGLKKANSVLHQGLSAIARENGYPLGDYSFLIEEKDFMDEFAKVTSVAKVLNNEIKLKEYSWLNGESGETAIINPKAIITTDGQEFIYSNSFGNYGISEEDFAHQLLGIGVDVNGERKPNRVGYDIFFFYLINGKGIVPTGAKSFDECNRQNSGVTCTSKVLKEGRISY